MSGSHGDHSRVILTKHAQGQIEDRDIPIEWVERTLFIPERTEPDREDPNLRHALARVPEFGNRVLRVVYNHTATPPRIVTVFFDRRQRNRL